MQKEDVIKFVETNKFPIVFQNMQSRCVDGRPADDENSDRIPAISKPGADIGDLIISLGALNKLNISVDPQIVMDTILQTYGGAFNIKFHTDSKAEGLDAGPGRGCGHINQAVQHPEDYNLTNDQTKYILNLLPELLQNGAKQVVLDGDHAEQAVLVIDSDYYGVRPYNSETQAFIYQKKLHEHQLDKLVIPLAKKVSESGYDVEPKVLRNAITEVFNQQLGATLSRIAQGLPIYNVSIPRSGEVRIQ